MLTLLKTNLGNQNTPYKKIHAGQNLHSGNLSDISVNNIATDTFNLAPRAVSMPNKQKITFGRMQGATPELNILLAKMKEQYGHLKGKNVAMLFSGGFDTSFLATVLKEEIGAKVHTVTFDLGDQRLSAKTIEKRAKQIGVYKHHTIDATDEFVQKYVLPSIQANAKYNGTHPLSSSLSRPLMMKKVVELAKEIGSPVVMQGTSPWQNNAPRFQKAFAALKRKSGIPDLKMELPVLKLNVSRELEREYLLKKGINITERQNKIESADGNIWNWEVEDGRVASKPFFRPDLQVKNIFNTPQNAPDSTETVRLTFRRGVPVKINGEKMPLRKIVEKLNIIGGKHGVGIHDALESRPLGHKEREIHVAPAADILITAHQDLEQAVLAQDTLNEKHRQDVNWTQAVCNGDWFRQTVRMFKAAIDVAQEKVTGTVKLELYKGHIAVLGRKSPYALDSHTLGLGKKGKIVPSQQGFKEAAFLSGIDR